MFFVIAVIEIPCTDYHIDFLKLYPYVSSNEVTKKFYVRIIALKTLYIENFFAIYPINNFVSKLAVEALKC